MSSEAVRKYNPDQPRNPKGQSDGGQWSGEGGGGESKTDWRSKVKWGEILYDSEIEPVVRQLFPEKDSLEELIGSHLSELPEGQYSVRVLADMSNDMARRQLTGVSFLIEGEGVSVRRTISQDDRGKLIAFHDNFHLDASLQGRGIASRVLAKSLDHYQSIGVSRIDLHAGAEAGGYVWAKLGFKPKYMSEFASEMKSRAGDILDAKYYGEMERILSKEGSRVAQDLANTSFGKRLMVGSAWRARLDLGDSEQVSNYRSSLEKSGKRSMKVIGKRNKVLYTFTSPNNPAGYTDGSIELLADDEREAIEVIQKTFDPNRPRDEEGQWTSMGGTLTSRDWVVSKAKGRIRHATYSSKDYPKHFVEIDKFETPGIGFGWRSNGALGSMSGYGAKSLDNYLDSLPKQIEKAYPRTLYVRRNVRNAADIIDWAKGQGLTTTLGAQDMHVTVAYSRTPVDWLKIQEARSSTKNGHVRVNPGGPRVVERLGPKNAVVLLFSSSELEMRHREMREKGASWDHQSYQPHITLTYSWDGGVSKIEPYRGAINLGPEIFEEVSESWSSNLVEKIIKIDEEQRIVYGWASVISEHGQPVVDTQGDIIEPEELLKACTNFMLDVRKAKAMHSGGKIGEVVHSFPLVSDIAKSLGIDIPREGWIVGVKVHDDSQWALVKNGTYKGFSIGAEAIREEVDANET